MTGTQPALRETTARELPSTGANGAGPAQAEAALDLAAIRVTTPAPRGAWREVLAADSDALVCHTPEWIDAICSGGGYEDASRLYETEAGTRLVLPMVRRRGPWPAASAPQASMPHAWGMGGFVIEGRVAGGELARVLADLAASPALRTHIRPNPLHDEAWQGARELGAIVIPRCAHVLDLQPGVDEIWRTLRSEGRRGVKRAEKFGIEVEFDGSGRLVPVFYRLLELSVERWARQQHEPLPLARWRARRRDPLEKFERMATSLGDAMEVGVAYRDGEPVAASVVLRGANVNDTRGAIDKERMGNTYANDLLQWLTIKRACEAGCRWFHLGESGDSRRLAHFKEKWGARPVRYSEYRFERLPLTRTDHVLRGLAKRVLRFRDA